MAYSFYRAVTVDHTKCGGTDSSNFPVLVAGTYAYLATVANGGKVQNGSGYDVGFFSDSALTTKLNWETELYTATTGKVAYWVKIPTLSHTADTVIYMAYGDASISTFQGNNNGTWDSNYKLVWHLSDNAATTTVADSTATASTGTNAANTSTKTATGEVASGLSYNGSSDGTKTAATLDLSGTNKVTLECWLNWTTFGTDDKLLLETSANYNSNNGALLIDPNSSGGNFDVAMHGVGGTGYNGGHFTRPSAGAWHHYQFTWDTTLGAVNSCNAWVDGASQSMTSDNVGNFASANFGNFTLNAMCRNQASLFGAGTLDEFRVSNALRSGDWALQSYNSQSSPSTFYTVGSETAVGGADPFPVGYHNEPPNEGAGQAVYLRL